MLQFLSEHLLEGVWLVERADGFEGPLARIVADWETGRDDDVEDVCESEEGIGDSFVCFRLDLYSDFSLKGRSRMHVIEFWQLGQLISMSL
jgi:hypothetical protein